jgi:DNA excision repair protein ERCC-2
MTHDTIPPEVQIFFPFSSLRAGQDLVIKNIYTALKEERHIIISAPNGFGKTITVLSSILPVIKESENALRIIYLTRTHVQSQHVIQELKRIIKHLSTQNYLLDLGGISLRGRSSMCFHPQVIEYTQDPMNAQLLCSELRSLNRCQYDTNLKENPGTVSKLLAKLVSHAVEASELLEICKNWEVCPYQISKLVLNGMDIIVGSYQWLLSPYIRDLFLQNIETSLNNIVLVLDEAHNVPDIAREIASNQLTYYSVQQMIREAEILKNQQIIDFGTNLMSIMDDLQDKVTDEIPISPQATLKKVFQDLEISPFLEQLVKLGESWRQAQLREGRNPRSFLYFAGIFWQDWVSKTPFKSYFFCVSKFHTSRGKESIKFEIISLDPKDILKPLLDQVYISIHLSGTIEPIHYYSDIIGIPNSAIELSVPSPFPKENILVLAMKSLSTKGVSRTKEMYLKYIQRCSEAVAEIPKNVGIFTASYDVLEGLLNNGLIKQFKSAGIEKQIFFEEKNQNSAHNDRMIAKFKLSAEKNGGVLLGVCGGRNAEGEDFPGDLMNGAILCGIPFAKPTTRIKALIDYYGGSQKGKDYAYNMPAFRRANQAAGRPIRTLSDRGIIILLDYRYELSLYKKFLSPWLRDRIVSLPDEDGQLAAEIRKFWTSPKR